MSILQLNITVSALLILFITIFIWMATISMSPKEYGPKMEACRQLNLEPKIQYNGWNGQVRGVVCIQPKE